MWIKDNSTPCPMGKTPRWDSCWTIEIDMYNEAHQKRIWQLKSFSSLALDVEEFLLCCKMMPSFLTFIETLHFKCTIRRERKVPIFIMFSWMLHLYKHPYSPSNVLHHTFFWFIFIKYFVSFIKIMIITPSIKKLSHVFLYIYIYIFKAI